ncbi:diaminopimelate decarboxylase, partial [Candidatus Micrarchaeota archaeon CG06_land_8_20_14_3_00_50_6]
MAVAELASVYGTPLYVIDASRVRANFAAIKTAFERHYANTKIYYAVKANSNLALLKLIRSLGGFADVASPGELRAAQLAGFGGNGILATANSLNDAEIASIRESGALFNFDSLAIYEKARRLGRLPELVSFRVNPGIGAGHHEHCVTGSR